MTRHATRLAAVFIVVLATACVASTWHLFGHTWDEPEHLAAGLSLLDHGRYEYDIQHPPIGRILMALGPWLAGAHSQGYAPPDGRPEGVAILYGEGHYERFLTLARAAMLPFLWLLLLATWLWSDRLKGSTTEPLLAVGFAASTPVLLGHAGLAALDVPAAATVLFALYLLGRWLEQDGWAPTLALGLGAGAAIGTKLSAMPFLAIGALVFGLLWHRAELRSAAPARPMRRPRLTQIALVIVVASAVFIAAYGSHWNRLTDEGHHYSHALNYLFGDAGRAHDLAYSIAAHVPLPDAFPLLVGGIEALIVHNRNGHLSFLLGEVRTHGWWYFYLVALFVKTPLPLLIGGLTGLVQLAIEGWRAPAPWRVTPAALALALLAFASFFSHINIGVRHVLILYPLLAIGAAHATARAWHWARGRPERWQSATSIAVIVLALLWQFLTPLRVFPDYLAYFNEFVAKPEAVLVDSDLDWGQDLRRLERRLAALRIPCVSIAYAGTADLAREPLPAYTVLGPWRPATGWVAISALARVHGVGGYDWVNRYEPVERVGKSIWLYHIPPSESGHGCEL